MKAFLETCLQQVLKDEDGNPLALKAGEGLTQEEICSYQDRLGIELPTSFQEMLAFSNGMDFFGVRILPITEQEFREEDGLLTFHDWGNGDFDAVVVESVKGPRFGTGQVVFVCHQTGCIVPVAADPACWIRSVYKEIRERNALMDPDDYETTRRNAASSGFRKTLGKLSFKKRKVQTALFGLYSHVREQTSAFEKNQKGYVNIKTAHYQNGRRASEYVYKNGKLDGLTRHWHENGRLKVETCFQRGKKHGRNVLWDKQEALVAEGYFRDGRMWEGDFMCEDEGGTESIETYHKGQLVDKNPPSS